MKKLLVTALVMALIGGALSAGPVAAKKKKKKKKAKPVATTLYMHGKSQFGEADLPEQWMDQMWNQMSTEKPGAGTPKSQFVTNYVGGPNQRCDGNGLLGTTWKGPLSGTVKGDVKLTLHTVSGPAHSLVIGLYPDGSGTCVTEGDPPPAAAKEEVQIAPGQTETEVVFKKVNFKAVGSLVVQIGSAPANPSQTRIFYDAESHLSRLDFRCIPARGKKCA